MTNPLCAIPSIFAVVFGLVVSEQPLTAQEYQQQLGFGFSVSWFSSPLAPTQSAGKQRYTHESMKVTVKDMAAKGITNLRLRCPYSYGFPDSAGGPAKQIDRAGMKAFLDELEFVVDEMINVGLYPVISWSTGNATKRGSEQDGKNFVQWWTEVAKRMKDKSYKLSFNMVTELGRQQSRSDPGLEHNLWANSTALNNWTKRAIRSIRETGGNNAERVVILVTPQNTHQSSLYKYDKDLYTGEYGPIMQEYHTSAGGPKGGSKRRCSWTGDGKDSQKQKFKAILNDLIEFSRSRNSVPIYFGAWMAQDNKGKTTLFEQWISFASFFARTTKEYEIPSSLNQINFYYDSLNNKWKTTNKMDLILDTILRQLNISGNDSLNGLID